MSRKGIRRVVMLGMIAILGIVATQVYWVKQAFDLREKQFHYQIKQAFTEVANELWAYSSTAPLSNPVEQISSDYYVVHINDEIDINVLEALLTREMDRRGLDADFEYGVYDCNTDRIVYGDFIRMSEEDGRAKPVGTLPRYAEDNYYFGVYFPGKQGYVLSSMDMWVYTSVVMLVVVVFFCYALFVILRQRRLSVVQRDFVNNMTHEFKTPLATIAISSEVLGKPETAGKPEKLARYADIIGQEAQRLKGQVERVLQVARLDREELKLTKEAVNLHEVVADAVEKLKLSPQLQGAALEVQLQATQPTVMGDPLHLCNVVYNLLDNAAKYCEGPPKILIKSSNTPKGLALMVQDWGIGIPKEALRHVWDRFYRVSTGDVHNVKGFGLGLFYVRRIIRAHGGKVQVQSQPGQGSTFTLLLPLPAAVETTAP